MSGKMFDKDYPTEWALNPSNFRAMDSDQVDWAALAQEWIKMKETHIPSAPTPPSISENPRGSSFGEGEAPMDMECKDDEIPPAPPAPNISGANNWNRWNQWESNWNRTGSTTNWDWNNVSPEANEPLSRIPSNLMIPPPAPIISCTPSFVDPSPSSIPLESTSSPSFGYNTMALPRSHFNNQVASSDFWINEQHAPGTTSFLPFPKDMRPAAGINRIPPSSAAPSRTTLPMLDMITSRNRDEKDKTPENDSLSSLDTIKRKQLPAWIREGLEKMEREKQKAVERERQAILCKRELEARKKLKEQARDALGPDASKFDSDSEKESTELETTRDLKVDSQDDLNKRQITNCDRDGSPDQQVTRPRKSRFRDASSPEKSSSLIKQPNVDVKTNNPIATVGPCVRMSKEELLQSLMLKVRRSLTEILLEVTNDEIMSTCEEVWKNIHNKGKILASGTTAPVAQITRRLGLGIYSDSDSESSDEHSIQDPSEKSIASRNDSDEELKENVRLRQQAFKKTEADIEASLAAEEEEDARGEGQLARNKRADVLSKNKHNDNDVKNDDRTFEKPASDVIASTSRSTPDRAQDSSSSSENGKQGHLSKRNKSHGCSSNGKNSSTIPSPRRRNARSSENTRRYSSSRSRSRSKNDSSSRGNSCDSSSSKLYANSASADRTVKKYECASESGYKGSGKRRSRSTSQSNFRSESRSRSRSRSKSRSRTSRSNSTVKSRHKRSRSRSFASSSFRKQTRKRNNLHSRSRHRSPLSHSRSRSTSRSRSRSRKRSKSSYGSSKGTATAQKSEAAKKRSTRSRSPERTTRRSRSNSRKSKSSHRQRSHRRYERDRSSKKSTRHRID